MSTKFGTNVEKEIMNEEIGCVLLYKSVPVLTLYVLQIAEDPHCVGRLATLAKSGYFSAVGLLYLIQKSRDPASCFYAQVDRTAATGYIRNILRLRL